MSCFNYSDDISILCKHRDYDSAYNDLLSEASTMIHRYKMNYMQASLEKIQFIILDKERQPMTLQLNHNVTIQSVLNVQYTCLNIHGGSNYDSLFARTVAYPVQVAYWNQRGHSPLRIQCPMSNLTSGPETWPWGPVGW